MYTIMMKRREGFRPTKKCHLTTVNGTVEELLKKGQYKERGININSMNFPPRIEGEHQIFARIVNIKQRPVFGDLAFEITMDNLYERGYEFADLREALSVFDQHENISSPSVVYVLATKIDKSYEFLAPCIDRRAFSGKQVYLESV